uniref:Preprotein translocase SecG subunit n=1 Tax=Olisthodiscus luteus TaxID=83000 RepID=A0A7U0KSR1_OLILU|nr:preprotein translocase SecG subunit [Olisthodiscus luteus]YP_010152835.1 preprotein translocase SecG subunit [Olisthodiscus luteus]QQW50456.1 preprotein translocase SecG subunit [Olisthodiscus luteus]QQW50496.1 preprotein translocase SecG subunit [Olisthodiscus luteus]
MNSNKFLFLQLIWFISCTLLLILGTQRRSIQKYGFMEIEFEFYDKILFSFASIYALTTVLLS